MKSKIKNMKTLFVSLLFTLVTTTAMAQTMKPSYDWEQFDEQSSKIYKEELIQYYDSKKQEIIKEYSSGWKSNYPESKKMDLEQNERNRKFYLEDWEFNYKWATRTQLEKTIDSIQVFIHSNKFRYGIGPICLGIVIGLLIRFFRKVQTQS